MDQNHSQRRTRSRAWYEASIEAFLVANESAIVGELTANSDFPVTPSQRDAWIGQIRNLKQSLDGMQGYLALEYSIPRMGRRIDTVAVIGPACFVVEYKVGEDEYPGHAIDQVWDYALDLKNFHAGSHHVPIVPILVSTESQAAEDPSEPARDADGVYQPLRSSGSELRDTMLRVLRGLDGVQIDGETWSTAPYQPTPTILEAARALYANHTVDDITRNDAGAINLTVTSRRVDALVDLATKENRKIICFVTGVPGAGKTLVGLNVATRHRRELEQPTHASFLSGNGPLVRVLCEALSIDEVKRKKASGEKIRKGLVSSQVKSVIQNVHHFRDEYIRDPSPPFDHVVIFDEAQRAWNRKKTADFMLRRKKIPDFAQSEPEFLISCLDRHRDWAVIVCLVGGGQEIHTGEAGIGAWLQAINERFPKWEAHISSRLVDSEYQADGELRRVSQRSNTRIDDSLHLAVCMRSFRAESVSSFVKALLDDSREEARRHFESLRNRYPIVVTRDLDNAKRWIRKQARGSERYGLMASSRAQRLKPHAVDVRVIVDPVHWFLKGPDDTRSSYFLEDAATEFQVQGMEVDWACVTWDGDLRYGRPNWSYHDFRGSRWVNVNKEERQRYVLNAYRVLLTRARQGMAIFVPPGDPSDVTRSPEYYDPTFQYLRDIGLPVV